METTHILLAMLLMLKALLIPLLKAHWDLVYKIVPNEFERLARFGTDMERIAAQRHKEAMAEIKANRIQVGKLCEMVSDKLPVKKRPARK